MPAHQFIHTLLPHLYVHKGLTKQSSRISQSILKRNYYKSNSKHKQNAESNDMYAQTTYFKCKSIIVSFTSDSCKIVTLPWERCTWNALESREITFRSHVFDHLLPHQVLQHMRSKSLLHFHVHTAIFCTVYTSYWLLQEYIICSD